MPAFTKKFLPMDSSQGVLADQVEVFDWQESDHEHDDDFQYNIDAAGALLFHKLGIVIDCCSMSSEAQFMALVLSQAVIDWEKSTGLTVYPQMTDAELTQHDSWLDTNAYSFRTGKDILFKKTGMIGLIAEKVATNPSAIRDWIASSYCELKVGSSTRDAIQKILTDDFSGDLNDSQYWKMQDRINLILATSENITLASLLDWHADKTVPVEVLVSQNARREFFNTLAVQFLLQIAR